MKMKKNVLSAAVLAVMSVGSAHAVNLSQTGTGEVLIFPYYNVNGGEETLMSVVNTTSQFKAVKVRFREGMNSREVLDFNLYLSPYDVWVAKVLDDGKNGAKIITPDKSCTVPPIPAEGVSFRSFDFDGTNQQSGAAGAQKQGRDGGPTDISRVREGYFEVIEMGSIPADMSATTWTQGGPWDSDNEGRGNAKNDAKHADGVPDNCKGLRDQWAAGGQWASNPNLQVRAPTGGLMGTSALINVGLGTEIAMDPTVLEAFRDRSDHTKPGSASPQLSLASPRTSVVLLNNGVNDSAQVIMDNWGLGEDAVSALLQSRSLMAEYSINPAVDAETDWVVTFPTKHYYADGQIRAPFTSNFRTRDANNNMAGRACEPVSKHYWDREENERAEDVDFSPTPNQGALWLCWEVNVLNFVQGDFRSDVLSTNYLTVTDNQKVGFQLESGYNSGWARLTFDAPEHNLVNPVSGNVYPGLPAIGFRATRLMNANVGVGAAYAVSDALKSRKFVTRVEGLALESDAVLYGNDGSNNYPEWPSVQAAGSLGIEEGAAYPRNLSVQLWPAGTNYGAHGFDSTGNPSSASDYWFLAQGMSSAN